jgi:hypothetical protein
LDAVAFLKRSFFFSFSRQPTGANIAGVNALIAVKRINEIQISENSNIKYD